MGLRVEMDLFTVLPVIVPGRARCIQAVNLAGERKSAETNGSRGGLDTDTL